MTIEQKIAQLMAESEQFDEASNVVTKNATASEPTELDKAPSEQNPDNAKGFVKDQKSAEGGTSKKSNAANKNATAPEASDLKSCKEDVDALINGEDLTEEFKAKAATIFEAAVFSRVKAEVALLDEQYAARLEEQVQEAVATEVEGLVEKVDGYLSYMAEQWMSDNEIALDRGIKSEILESFVSSLRGVFVEHNIDIPEEAVDVVAEMESTVAELEDRLNESEQRNIQLTQTLATKQRGDLIEAKCAGLTDTEVEKFKGLAEELVFEGVESFDTKLRIIRENYFDKKAKTPAGSSMITEEVQPIVESASPRMSAYASFLSGN